MFAAAIAHGLGMELADDRGGAGWLSFLLRGKSRAHELSSGPSLRGAADVGRRSASPVGVADFVRSRDVGGRKLLMFCAVGNRPTRSFSIRRAVSPALLMPTSAPTGAICAAANPRKSRGCCPGGFCGAGSRKTA
jgi:hypothetical protein